MLAFVFRGKECRSEVSKQEMIQSISSSNEREKSGILILNVAMKINSLRKKVSAFLCCYIFFSEYLFKASQNILITFFFDMFPSKAWF